MGDVVGLSDQALLEESGSLPVDVTEMCEQLQIKVDQANKWVDKVSSFNQLIVNDLGLGQSSTCTLSGIYQACL
jgi:hypothetical protein